MLTQLSKEGDMSNHITFFVSFFLIKKRDVTEIGC